MSSQQTSQWEHVKATEGYHFVEKWTPSRSHLLKRFTFWGDDGSIEADRLTKFLNDMEGVT